MGVKLKRIEDQVVVITGASSGIGLATAKMAAEFGARVVLAARDPEGLASARVEIEGSGGRAITVVADVANLEDVQSIAERAMETFGCDNTLKLTNRWIGAQPRSHRWVVRWSETQGARCDCEVIANVLRDDKRSARHRKVRCAPSYRLAANEIGRCQGAEG